MRPDRRKTRCCADNNGFVIVDPFPDLIQIRNDILRIMRAYTVALSAKDAFIFDNRRPVLQICHSVGRACPDTAQTVVTVTLLKTNVLVALIHHDSEAVSSRSRTSRAF